MTRGRGWCHDPLADHPMGRLVCWASKGVAMITLAAMRMVETAAKLICIGVVGAMIQAMVLVDLIAGTSYLKLERRGRR